MRKMKKNRNVANELKVEYEKRLQDAKKEAEAIVQLSVEKAEKSRTGSNRKNPPGSRAY